MYSIHSRLNIWLGIVLVSLSILHLSLVNHLPRDLIQSYVFSQLKDDAQVLLTQLSTLGSLNELNKNDVNVMASTVNVLQIQVDQSTFYSAPLTQQHLSFPPLQENQIKTFAQYSDNKQFLMLARQTKQHHQTIKIMFAQDMTQVNQLIHARHRTYLIGFAISIVFFILLQHFLIRKILQPIDKARNELLNIQQGKRETITQPVPREFQPLVDEVNTLLTTNQQRLVRSRHALGNLAHALKTPLTILTQLADSQDAKYPSQLAIELQQLSLEMQNIINHELKRARLAGASSSGEHLNIGKEIKSLCDVLKKIYHHKSLQIDYMNVATETQLIQADREDMMELLGNLLDNACKWATRNIKITLFAEQALRFCIEDDGEGIAKEKLQELTQRGIRLDENTPGHGLGLSIVSDIIKQYEGKILFTTSSALGGLKVDVCLGTAKASVDK